MADSQRALAISGFVTALQTISSIKAVVKAGEDLNLVEYTASQVPLAQVQTGDEVPRVSKSSFGHALWQLPIRLTCYFLGDIEDVHSVGEPLVKSIKDKIGSDNTLGQTCIDCEVEVISITGRFPLWRLEMRFLVKFERSLSNV
jgi:hypothetical protein